jgi:hypothetical protein
MNLFAHRPPSLHKAIAGRALTGLLLQDNSLFLRFVDATLALDLDTRAFIFRPLRGHWMTFPGWLRIARVLQDDSQVTLEVCGALFTSRLVLRKSDGAWRVIFQGGRILASA